MGYEKAYGGVFVQSRIWGIQAHKSKYDEAGHCISYGKGGLVASGGADGVVKVFGIEP